MGVKVQDHLAVLGRTMKDKVTGRKGVIISVSFDLFGCIQYLIKPKVDKDGKDGDARWYDHNRLEFDMMQKERVMALPDFQLEKGPAHKPVSYRS